MHYITESIQIPEILLHTTWHSTKYKPKSLKLGWNQVLDDLPRTCWSDTVTTKDFRIFVLTAQIFLTIQPTNNSYLKGKYHFDIEVPYTFTKSDGCWIIESLKTW